MTIEQGTIAVDERRYLVVNKDTYSLKCSSLPVAFVQFLSPFCLICSFFPEPIFPSSASLYHSSLSLYLPLVSPSFSTISILCQFQSSMYTPLIFKHHSICSLCCSHLVTFQTKSTMGKKVCASNLSRVDNMFFKLEYR